MILRSRSGHPQAGREAEKQTGPDMALRVLHVDPDWIAVDKPAGLLVHASAMDAHEALNALDLLREQLGAPLWTVHRLDKATSGVLLFARHAEAARALGAAFATAQVGKRYLAVVRGWPPTEGVIDHPLARDPERPSTGQPQLAASTRYRRLSCHDAPFSDGRHAGSRCALVEVEPSTGRRHQIRRHFKHIAHPLIGDSTHGKGPLNRAFAQWLGISRLWLHANRLVVPGRPGQPAAVIEALPGPEWQVWQTPMPR